MSKQKVAVVSGANRGLGLAAGKGLAAMGFHVVLGCRDAQKGEQAAQTIRDEGHSASSCVLEVTEQQQIDALAAQLRDQFGRVDVLVNNAGILLDKLTDAASIFDASADAVNRSFQVNTLAPLQLCNALLPLMRENNYGRIVNVSSGMGQLGDMGGGHAGYRISKAALNAVTGVSPPSLATKISKSIPCARAGCAPIWAVRMPRGRLKRASTRPCGWRRCRTTAPAVDSSAIASRLTGDRICR